MGGDKKKESRDLRLIFFLKWEAARQLAPLWWGIVVRSGFCRTVHMTGLFRTSRLFASPLDHFHTGLTQVTRLLFNRNAFFGGEPRVFFRRSLADLSACSPE